jgi:hypothetical protein
VGTRRGTTAWRPANFMIAAIHRGAGRPQIS